MPPVWEKGWLPKPAKLWLQPAKKEKKVEMNGDDNVRATRLEALLPALQCLTDKTGITGLAGIAERIFSHVRSKNPRVLTSRPGRHSICPPSTKTHPFQSASPARCSSWPASCSSASRPAACCLLPAAPTEPPDSGVVHFLGEVCVSRLDCLAARASGKGYLARVWLECVGWL